MFCADEEGSSLRCIATIGLHSSASTWVFNVVRELMCYAFGAECVLAIYAEQRHEIPDVAALGERHLILKSHHGSAGLDAWLHSLRPTMILSIRDPRDAAMSMAQRFGAPLETAAQWLLNDCRRFMVLGTRGHRLLRYEDRFFEDPLVLAQLSAAIAPGIPAHAQSTLFERYNAESVRQFASRLASLPPERLLVSDRMMMDRLTQIHRDHVGDTRSGEWRGLPGSTRTKLTRLFEPFLQRFGYESTVP
jgi:hypothetical protein